MHVHTHKTGSEPRRQLQLLILNVYSSVCRADCGFVGCLFGTSVLNFNN